MEILNIFSQMQSKIEIFQNTIKQNPLLIIFLIQYLRLFSNTKVIQALFPLKILNKVSRFDFYEVYVQDEIHSFLNFSVVLGRVIALKVVFL